MNIDFELNLNHDREWQMHSHHFHEGYEILLSLSDAGSTFIEDTLYPLNRGTLIFIRDTALHRTIAAGCDSYSRYVLHFDRAVLERISTPQTDFLKHFILENRCVQLEPMELSALQPAFEACMGESGGGFGEDLRRSMAFVELLIRVHGLFGAKAPSRYDQNTDFRKVAPIIQYIQQNLGESLKLEEIANHFFINKYHLCHRFKAVTGFSVGEYIIHNRVMKARALLRGGMSVQETGELSGFQNNAHFIRTFGKLSGMSPGKYRKAFAGQGKGDADRI